MRISDWSSDVCSSDLRTRARARYMEGFDAVPGVADFLGALGATPRAIASSSRAEYIGWALGLFGLGHHFGEHVYSADGWDRGKPHPDIYLAAPQRSEERRVGQEWVRTCGYRGA